MNKVENLKKITLSFQAGNSPNSMDLSPKCPDFAFIFGLGPEGMTPFEYELVDKTEGEEVMVNLSKKTFGKFFEHLNPPLMDLFEDRDNVNLKAKIVSVAAADNREVVKAIANVAAYGESGCDCGCDYCG